MSNRGPITIILDKKVGGPVILPEKKVNKVAFPKSLTMGNKSKSVKFSRKPDFSDVLSQEILDQFLPPVDENDKFNEYYDELSTKIVKKFSKEKWIKLKIQLEKEQKNAIRYRQQALQERITSHLKLHKKGNFLTTI